jgi:DNA-binding NtrC family response regulator
MVVLNCSNLVEGLAESQLFGHVKGAFTHAHETQIGCFRQANGGTLVLDEIGELPLGMQGKLLRVLDTFEIQAVGSTEVIRVVLRLIASTNRDLPAMVRAGQFRADLYYRLNVASIRVPALRERREDIPALAAHFFDYHNDRFGKRVRLIAGSVLDFFRTYEWPGNARELTRAIERAVLLCHNDRVEPADLPDELRDRALAARNPPALPVTENAVAAVAQPSRKLDEVIKQTVQRALIAASGDCAHAARLLGISRPAIYRKMSRFGITQSWYRQYRRSEHRAVILASEPPHQSADDEEP